MKLIDWLYDTLPTAAPIYVCITLACIVSLVPIDFFLCHIVADGAQYFLMASHVAATGSAAASGAVNGSQIVYAPGMAYVYAPVMFFFHEYAWRMRTIQYLNIALIGIFFWLSIAYFRKAAPFADVRWFCGLYAIVLIFSSKWEQAAMLLNADIVPGILTVGAALVAGHSAWRPAMRYLVLILIGTVGFFVKPNLAVIPLVFGCVELFESRGTDRRIIAAGLAIVVAIPLVDYKLLLHYLYALQAAYLPGDGHNGQLLHYLLLCVSNAWFVALPGTIIPNLRYFLVDDVNYVTTVFAPHYLTLRLIVGSVVGCAISACIAVGVYRLWRIRPYDVFLFLCSLCVFAAMPNSTGRYLLVFQPFLYVTVVHALRPFWPRLKSHKAIAVSAAGALVLLFVFFLARSIELRSRDTAHWQPNVLIDYVDGVTNVYSGELAYLEGQAPETTDLLAVELPGWALPSQTDWGAVTDLRTYSTKHGIPPSIRGQRMLIPIVCRIPYCSGFPLFARDVARRWSPQCYAPNVIWHRANSAAMGEVLELAAIPNCRPSKRD